MLRIPESALLACRLLLAAVFLFAGATKLVDPWGFRKGLRDFGLPAALAPLLMLILPLLELAVGAVLIPARLAWYGAGGALALLGAFSLAVAVAMVRGREPECHCFGQLHSAPVGRATLIRNGALAASAAWLVARGPMRSGPDVWSWFLALDVSERKIALVAAGIALFLFFRLLGRARPRREVIEAPIDLADEDEPEQPPRLPAAPPRPAPMGVGLPIGTPAPPFELPGLTGGKYSLESLLHDGRDLLLVFSSPYCDPCRALATQMAGWLRAAATPKVVIISRGAVKDNLAKWKGFETARILLQRNSEVADAYDCNVTPTAVLVGADGLIRSELVVGRPAIQQRFSSRAAGADPAVKKEVAR